MCPCLAIEGQLRKLSGLLSFKVELLLFSVFLVAYKLAFENKDLVSGKRVGFISLASSGTGTPRSSSLLLNCSMEQNLSGKFCGQGLCLLEIGLQKAHLQERALIWLMRTNIL